MARKLFGMIEAGARGLVDEEEVGEERPAQNGNPAPNRMLSTTRLSDGLMSLQANSIRDLDPSAIIQSGTRDRIDIKADGIKELAKSIAEHGQHVPVLVRPLPGEIDRYEIVYGRRRLAAIRLIGGGMTVKAIVRKMGDEEAVVAQGHENNLRLDPSHIEKALFAAELRQKKFSNDIIMEALNVDRFAISKMVKLIEDIPEELIELIGPAHDIGRRPWRELGDLVASGKIDAVTTARRVLEDGGKENSSSERFRFIHDALRKELSAPSQNRNAALQQLVHGPTRRMVGERGPGPALEFKTGSRALSLSFRTKANPEFGSWLERNIDKVVSDLHERWMREGKGD
jgi:ParB family transcriptional regulator, chromosome partitioning protein